MHAIRVPALETIKRAFEDRTTFSMLIDIKSNARTNFSGRPGCWILEYSVRLWDRRIRS
jgi:hypothetical protein